MRRVNFFTKAALKSQNGYCETRRHPRPWFSSNEFNGFFLVLNLKISRCNRYRFSGVVIKVTTADFFRLNSQIFYLLFIFASTNEKSVVAKANLFPFAAPGNTCCGRKNLISILLPGKQKCY